MIDLRNVLIAAGLICFINLNAQSYSNPESVEYDASQDRYLVSNTNSGQILARDQVGNLSVFATLTGSGPHGLEIQDSVVYACNGNRVRGFDLSSGAQVFDLNLNGSFLNGITSDGTFLYVTDFGASKVFKVDVANQTFTTLVGNTNGTPNGIVYDSSLDVLWVVFWGSNAAIKQYTPDIGSLSSSFNTGLTNIDGVALDCFNNLFVASWSPDQITQYPVGSQMGTPMPWTVSNPADIDYDSVNNKICIPNTNTNSVSLETVANCATGVEETGGSAVPVLYPVPAGNMLFIEGVSAGDLSYSIYNSLGMVVLDGKTLNQVVELHELRSGTYSIRINGLPAITFIKN